MWINVFRVHDILEYTQEEIVPRLNSKEHSFIEYSYIGKEYLCLHENEDQNSKASDVDLLPINRKGCNVLETFKHKI